MPDYYAVGRAEKALHAYQQQVGILGEGWEEDTVLVALLADLMEWAEVNGFTFADLIERAREMKEMSVEAADAILGYDVGSQTFCKACAPRSVVGTPLKPGEWFICGTCSDVYGDMPGKAP